MGKDSTVEFDGFGFIEVFDEPHTEAVDEPRGETTVGNKRDACLFCGGIVFESSSGDVGVSAEVQHISFGCHGHFCYFRVHVVGDATEQDVSVLHEFE